MRLFMIASAFALLATSPVLAADNAPASPEPAFSSTTTQLGTLLENPATKAVLMKHIPQFVTGLGENTERASGMTLKEVQDALKAYSPDALPDAKLAEIDVDLAKVPAPK